MSVDSTTHEAQEIPSPQTYLRSTDVIDWDNPTVLQLAQNSVRGPETQGLPALLWWVRDEVRRSMDYKMNPVTCAASRY